ncbi:unnamed protein product [Owenia fusiformis]|uniref:Uncharacterized protein n=1 Tax=Owenia fusiformis TaxID=6347 RepID=A0A8J1Y5T9_OWEFU|nr:unnamed protein product [Owenia fusiformis]
MAIFDRTYGGYRVFIGDLGRSVSKYDLEREFEYYGNLMDVWIARKTPGVAFLVYKHADDAENAVHDRDGRQVFGRRIRVEHAKPYERRQRGPPPPRYGGSYNGRRRTTSLLIKYNDNDVHKLQTLLVASNY